MCDFNVNDEKEFDITLDINLVVSDYDEVDAMYNADSDDGQEESAIEFE